MSHKFGVLLSYDIADQAIASAVRQLLEGVFRNAEVAASGTDVESAFSSRWFRANVRASAVFISLVSRRAVGSKRLHFEAGAGFATGNAFALCTDGVRVQDLRAPLSWLPAFSLDENGMRRLIAEISVRAEVALPPQLPGLSELIQSAQSFLSLRDHGASGEFPMIPESERAHKDPLDVTSHSLYRRLKEQLRLALIRSILKVGERPDLPSRDALKQLDLEELSALAGKINVPVPDREHRLLLTYEQDIPGEQAPRWKKLNAYKLMEDLEEGLRRFEKGL